VKKAERTRECRECKGKGFVRSGNPDLPKPLSCCYCAGTGRIAVKPSRTEPKEET
jgi:DnaJ-class molecular chaperone